MRSEGISEDVERAIAAIAADRVSGASELVRQSADVLRRARELGADALARAAAGVCRAQPSMAPIWIAAGLALADLADAGGRLDLFTARVERANGAVARVARDLLLPSQANGVRELTLVTFSASSAVRAAIEAIGARCRLRVAVAEGAPAREGRALAEAIVAAGVAVDVYSDAAIGTTLDGAAAVLVGADAVAPAWFINKVGTGALAALAGSRGIPVYVLAGREKFLPAALADAVTLRGGEPAEIWADPPARVTVRNPYFERIPLDLVAAVVTDTGVIGAMFAHEICAANERLLGDRAIAQLTAASTRGER